MTVLAIDDDPTQLELLGVYCGSLEYPRIEYLKAENRAEGLALAHEKVVDLVFTDLHLPDGTGSEVLAAVKAMNPAVAVVAMTAYQDTTEAVGLLKAGADDYLTKPVRKSDIERILLRVNERDALVHEAFLPPSGGLPPSPKAAGIMYQGYAMASMLSTAARAAAGDTPILISGESGTGKELVARFIHERSGRKGPFVAVNISALTESLAESELFGHAKGAFTGATLDRVGRFEEADGGTLFLDEIGETSLSLQVKLLRAIQFGEIERVGENAARRLDVHIVAATNRDLAAMVAAGSFRRDLYYRVNVIEIRLPPLRERKEDIRLLVDHFIQVYAGRSGKAVAGISREACDSLVKRSFPGNVRELENLVERAVVLCRGDVLRVEDFPPEAPEATPEGACAEWMPSGDYEKAMKDFEGALLRDAIEKAGGNKSAAARALGMGERHLRSRLSVLGLE